MAFQGDKFFYLDPHLVHTALPLHDDISKYSVEDVDSCHTRRLRRLSIEEMDPSMLIGFLIQNEDDWKRWRSLNNDLTGKPVVHIADIEPVHLDDDVERQSAMDEVETIDDENESDSELIERPKHDM